MARPVTGARSLSEAVNGHTMPAEHREVGMDVSALFSQAELAAVEAAVRGAEATTSGEIVPVVVTRSHDYADAVWRGATLGALAGVLLADGIFLFGGFWGLGWLWISLPVLLGGAAGFVAVSFLPALRRALSSPDEMDRQVRRRALQAFVEHEVFATRERTGVLVLLSLFERRVVVLGDAGINAKVEQREWDGIAADLAAGVRGGKTAEALVTAISRCGELLQRQGVQRRDDDTNELPDGLLIEGE
jgi:putative membrane protein